MIAFIDFAKQIWCFVWTFVIDPF